MQYKRKYLKSYLLILYESFDSQKFQHPIYTQIHGKFMPEMSIIDLLFNEGKDGAKEILQNSVVSSS